MAMIRRRDASCFAFVCTSQVVSSTLSMTSSSSRAGGDERSKAVEDGGFGDSSSAEGDTEHQRCMSLAVTFACSPAGDFEHQPCTLLCSLERLISNDERTDSRATTLACGEFATQVVARRLRSRSSTSASIISWDPRQRDQSRQC